MSKTSFIILLIICLVLIIIAKLNTNSNQHINVTSQALMNFDAEQIKQINITSKDKKIILKSVNNKWISPTSDDFEVNTQKISELMLKLIELQSSESLNSTKEDYSSLGLDDAQKISIELFDGNEKKVTGIDIGKNQETSKKSPYAESGKFIKPFNSDKVYITLNNVDVSLENNFWLNNIILNIDSKNIKQINLIKTNPSVVLIKNAADKDKEQFHLKTLQNKDKEKTWAINQVAGIFSNLTFSNVYKPDSAIVKDLKFEKLVEVHTEDNLVYNFMAADNNGKFYIKILDDKFSKWVYEIESYTASSFTRQYKDLIETPEPPKAPSQKSDEPNKSAAQQ